MMMPGKDDPKKMIDMGRVGEVQSGSIPRLSSC